MEKKCIKLFSLFVSVFLLDGQISTTSSHMYCSLLSKMARYHSEDRSKENTQDFKCTQFQTRIMKYLIILSLYCQMCYSASETTSVTRMALRAPCENLNKNALIEHFFNTIFTEFYTSPPVCVCVQMCVGQSTYCYPNGCLKSAAHEGNGVKTEITQNPVTQKNKNNYLLQKGERDFMTEFLEQNYVNELKDASSTTNPVENMRPDSFKKKYNIVEKYKPAPNVNLRNNLQEKVKKDVIKTDGVDWNKIKWPLSAQNWRNGRRPYSNIEKPLKSQGTYFAALLRDNDVAEYPPKYFKRELTKTGDDDEENLKSFYYSENLLNVTDGKIISLDALIENLIKSSFVTNMETAANVVAKRDDIETETKAPTEKVKSTNSTGLGNATTSVISMNFTDENIDRNRYIDTAEANKIANLSDMITVLANQIEIENNTSMEIARKRIKDFDEDKLKEINIETTLFNSTIDVTEVNSISNEITLNQTLSTQISANTKPGPEATTLHEVIVTKKNRQKVVKKASSKMNNPDINLKF